MSPLKRRTRSCAFFTAEELYRFMVDQFHQSRAFVLEFLVVIILMIELFWLFKGSIF